MTKYTRFRYKRCSARGRPGSTAHPSVNLRPLISLKLLEQKVEIKNAIRHTKVLPWVLIFFARGRPGGTWLPNISESTRARKLKLKI